MFSQTYTVSTKAASELQADLESKKKTNFRWMLGLMASSIVTVSLVGVMTFFSMSLGAIKSEQDECGLVYSHENLKITNGIAAVPHSWPAQVMILFNYYVANYSLTHPNSSEDIIFIGKSFNTLCAGTLIDRWTVMTASHCIAKSFKEKIHNMSFEILVEPNEFFPTYESMFSLYLGMHKYENAYKHVNLVEKRSVRKIIMYPKFNETTLTNDITILKLEKEAVLSEKVQIACLPETNSNSYPPHSTLAFAVGWGRTTAEPGTDAKELMNTLLTVLDETDCQYKDLQDVYFGESKFCAADLTNMNKSVCHGDSGGSLYVQEPHKKGVRFVSAGIVSYGYKCSDSRYPGYFTRVSHYVDWIRSHMGPK